MNIEKSLQENISEFLSSNFGLKFQYKEIILLPTRKEFLGSHTFTCFHISKQLGIAPTILANQIGKYLIANVPDVRSVNVVSGFLNIELSDSFLAAFLQTIINNQSYGQLQRNGLKVMVEFSSPNTNKPLHLGHLRNNFLGFAVSEILKAAGYEVIKANLVNDRGIHICKSMWAYEKFGNHESPESSGLKGDHLVGKYYVKFDVELKMLAVNLTQLGWTQEEIDKKNPMLLEVQDMLIKWEMGDVKTIELWKKLNIWVYEGFNQTYKKLGISFDKIYYESNTYLLGKEVVKEGLNSKIFFKKSDGSVWIDLTNEGLDEKLVLRADGTSVYITQDIGAADLKFNDYQADHSVYVVGNEQDYHFNVLKLIMKKLNRSYADGIFHLSYGMVDLPTGKMKSREGTVVDADDLIQEMYNEAEQQTRALGKLSDFDSVEAKTLYHTVGMGALKYYLLKVDPKKRMMFNPIESIDFHGNTGPFIQYTYARIFSILLKARQMDINFSTYSILDYIIHKSEREVLVHLLEFDNKIIQAAQQYSPSVIANYVYDLAKLFNTFYAEVSIFQESNLNLLRFRLSFCFAVSQTIKVCTRLIGIEVPERM